MKSFAVALLGLAMPFVLGAQNAQNDPFIGTWKLNVAKSKFNPGPAPKGETVTIAQDKVTVEEIHADGKTENWSYTPTPGGTATISGMENSSVMEKRVNDHTMEHTWKMGNSTMQGKGVVSKNGKKMTYTLTGTGPDGKPVHNVDIFEKQS